MFIFLIYLGLNFLTYSFLFQYKFIVDGEWRHDEHQPFVSGSYGTVNTILLSRDSSSIPTIMSPRTPSGSSMDVDNDAFQRVVLNISTEFLSLENYGYRCSDIGSSPLIRILIRICCSEKLNLKHKEYYLSHLNEN